MAYDFLLGCLGIYVFCPMGFAHDMWWGTYVKCMLCPCMFMFVLRSCSPFGWTAGRISILSIFRRRSPSPSMVRKAFATTTDLLPSTTTSTSLRDDDRSVPGVYFSILRVMADTIRRPYWRAYCNLPSPHTTDRSAVRVIYRRHILLTDQ